MRREGLTVMTKLLEGLTDMTNLVEAFRNLAKAPKTSEV